MTERRIMTLLGKKLQKKRKESRSNFLYYGKIGNDKKYPFVFHLVPFEYTYSGNVYLSCLVKTKT